MKNTAATAEPRNGARSPARARGPGLRIPLPEEGLRALGFEIMPAWKPQSMLRRLLVTCRHFLGLLFGALAYRATSAGGAQGGEGTGAADGGVPGPVAGGPRIAPAAAPGPAAAPAGAPGPDLHQAGADPQPARGPAAPAGHRRAEAPAQPPAGGAPGRPDGHRGAGPGAAGGADVPVGGPGPHGLRLHRPDPPRRHRRRASRCC